MSKTNQKTRQVGNGEGSLYHSDTLNCWIYQYYVNGKRKTIKQRKNEQSKEFKKRVTTLKNELNTGSYVENNSITVYELGYKINENKLKRNIIRENTYNRNLHTLNIIKDSPIANIQIQKITFEQLQDFLDSNIIKSDTGKPYSSSTINKLYRILQAIFCEALKKDYIVKNPMLKVDKPKSNKSPKKVEAFTIDEQKSFLNILDNSKEKYRDIFIIALYSGMRIGEILALKKNDINFKENTITIRRCLSKNKECKIIVNDDGITKTYNSLRTIPITPLFEKELRHAINTMVLNVNNFLFLQPTGEFISPSSINSVFKRICVNASLAIKPYNIVRKNKHGKTKIIHSKTSSYNEHMLRHTYATRCIESGMPAEVLQKLLGHKNISTTIDTYTSIFNKYKQEQIDKYTNYMKNIL